MVIWLLFGVFGFLSSIRQPWVFSEKREMLQYSEVKPQYTLSSKVKVGFTVSTLHVQDTGWSEIMQGGAKGEVTRHHLKEKAVKYK